MRAERLSTKAFRSLVPRPCQPQCGLLSVSRAGRRVWCHLSCFHVQMERPITRCHVIRMSLAINYRSCCALHVEWSTRRPRFMALAMACVLCLLSVPQAATQRWLYSPSSTRVLEYLKQLIARLGHDSCILPPNSASGAPSTQRHAPSQCHQSP